MSSDFSGWEPTTVTHLWPNTNSSFHNFYIKKKFPVQFLDLSWLNSLNFYFEYEKNNLVSYWRLPSWGPTVVLWQIKSSGWNTKMGEAKISCFHSAPETHSLPIFPQQMLIVSELFADIFLSRLWIVFWCCTECL